MYVVSGQKPAKVQCDIKVFLNLTESFSCFFLSSKANARVKVAKTGYGPHVVICVVLCIVCVYVLLPPGDNPIAVNKYIISYHILQYYRGSQYSVIFAATLIFNLTTIAIIFILS